MAITDALVPVTIGEAIAAAAASLRRSGIEPSQREARLLLSAATGRPYAEILGWPERCLEPREQRKFGTYLDRRLVHEPLSRIVGRRGFWTLDLAISSATLDPRPDTETIVESALAHLDSALIAGSGGTNPRIVDFGTGTGAILLALLSELPGAWGLGIDLSPAALLVAQSNAREAGLAERSTFLAGDWADMLRRDGSALFDLIVSNPPYISTAEIPRLEPEVRDYDPIAALDGGADGLSAYRRLMPVLPVLMAPRGIAVLEIGQGQEKDVAELARLNGLELRDQRTDLQGIIRALVLHHGTPAIK